MSTRVCSPPSNLGSGMDSAALPTSSSTQASATPQNPILFGSSSSGGGGNSGGGMTEFTLTLRSKNVARSLFGPPDPRSGQYARDKVKEIRERDKARWNFDFDNEKPLIGRYEWVPLAPSTASASGSSLADIPNPYAFPRLPNVYSEMASNTASRIIAGLHARPPLLSPFPPTPVKINPKERVAPGDRSVKASSTSSQSSPETSSHFALEGSIPSSPSSLEEGSSSPLEEEAPTIRPKTTKLAKSQQQQITQFMPSRKRPAHTRTTSPSAEKKAAL